jgi:hypothetical protein
MAPMLPKLFFDHFGTTSFVAVHDDFIVGFVIAFVSQSASPGWETCFTSESSRP